MNEHVNIVSDEARSARRAFISYATANRNKALKVCRAIECRGISCWISCRDVEPGENYQEAIVRQIRSARAVVLVFSDAANSSDEIKKELSLASRYHIPVLALRIEDVEPSDAFAYELSTRQWIDAFSDWDRSLDSLVRKIDQGVNADSPPPGQRLERRGKVGLRRWHFSNAITAAVTVVFLLCAAGIAWVLLRPRAAAGQKPVVRLAEFERLSSDVPAGLPNALRDEIMAAFTEEGSVNVSTAPAASRGNGPAYALSSTIRRDGDQIRVIAKLVNERSGATLWSDGYKYPSAESARIPRWVAVDVGNLLHCGLYAASTYRKSLPDTALSDYLQFCQGGDGPRLEPARSLDFARKVVAAVPDFSWGWSAVAGAAAGSMFDDPTGPRAASLHKEALAAIDKAISLDPSNSNALETKSYLIDQNDLVGREALLSRAATGRPDASYSEHFAYGVLLDEVGRSRDAIEEYRRSLEVMPLDADTHAWLGLALLRDGEAKEAQTHFDAARELSPDYRFTLTRLIAVIGKTEYAAALQSVDDKQDISLFSDTTSAYRLGFRALMSGDPIDRAHAVKALSALSVPHTGEAGILMLAQLGAEAEAVKTIEAGTRDQRAYWRGFLFYPALARARADPGFAGVAQRLGLMRYWRATRTKPDVCFAADAPMFCHLI